MKKKNYQPIDTPRVSHNDKLEKILFFFFFNLFISLYNFSNLLMLTLKYEVVHVGTSWISFCFASEDNTWQIADFIIAAV